MNHRLPTKLRLGTELNRLQADLNSIRQRLEQNGGTDPRMLDYLDKIEAKKNELSARVLDWRTSRKDVRVEIRSKLQQARDQLAIANRAVRARLH